MEIFLSVVMMFALFGACFAVSAGYFALKNKRTPPPPPGEKSEAMVYYIGSAPKPRQKRRPKKPHNVALKGVLPPKGTVVVAEPEVIRQIKEAKTSASKPKVPEIKTTPPATRRATAAKPSRAKSPSNKQSQLKAPSVKTKKSTVTSRRAK